MTKLSDGAIKDKIIVSTLRFIEYKYASDKEAAVDHLRVLSKIYAANLKAKPSKLAPLRALREFVINESGYMVTIPSLFNSLSNA